MSNYNFKISKVEEIKALFVQLCGRGLVNLTIEK